MSNVKPLPKPASLRTQKAEAVAEVEEATGIETPDAIKKVLFKAINKTSNGSMHASELMAIKEACVTYLEIDKIVGKKK